ncbi:SDR family oxidoreductase [Sphingomonas sanguinis]|uniref:SDR family oxidoreductase n=1 Tax=Sphingomonas sp. LC-1 TaxID=3110957 RepID=UPI0021BA4DF3|nr:SDR family oxidoreductase [Sphingomonas sp. LC-1]MCT8003581.1 SDR family oxidoreductase [Sphingomonas sp. LC-1]
MTIRTVLVTGAAKRLGAVIARRLAADGHRAVLHYHGSQDEAEALAEELDAPTVQGDLADLDGIDALFARARDAAGGPIDGLVNSASAFVFDRPPQVDAALMARLHAINAAAPALLTSALARQDEVTDGAVVDLLDQKLANPNPDFFAYSCAKFALAGANMMLAQALGPRIAVNAIAPGLTLQSGDQSDAEFATASVKNLLGRPIGAAAVAEAVSFLLTARGIRGQVLHVDCGQRFCRRDGDVMFEGRG